MKTNWIIFFMLVVFASGCVPPPYKEGRPYIGMLQTIGREVQLAGKQVKKDRYPVYSGDKIETGANSSAYLYFKNGGFVQLDENTDPEFKEVWEGTKCFIVMIGQLIGVSYYESEDGECALRFRNRTADAVRQGTKVNFKVTREHTIITVLEGSMLLTYPRNLSIQAGRQTGISQKGVEWTRQLSDSELEETVKWRGKYPLPLSRHRITNGIYTNPRGTHHGNSGGTVRPTGPRSPGTLGPRGVPIR